MSRPTTRDLADAHEDIEVLAYAHDPLGSPRFNSGFREIAKLGNLFAWLVTEIKMAERAAAYGPGVKGGYHTLHRGGDAADIDARTRDAHAKALRNLLSSWRMAVDKLETEFEREGIDVGRYPTRSEQAV